jgi:hypothetical protein
MMTRAAGYSVISVSILTASCSNPNDSNNFVKKGDVFFDDAYGRLSPLEHQELQRNGSENVRGFFFVGEHKSCIVIFSVRRGLVSHRPQPAYCYDRKTNQFIERL